MADRKISDLTALTTPASGDYVPIVDISESAAASKNKRITIQSLFQGIPVNVGIGTSSPGAKLHVVGSAGTNFGVSDGSAYGLRIDNGIAYGLTGSTIHGVDQTFFGSYQPLVLNGSQLGFAIGGTERLRIDSSGRVGIGTSAPAANLSINNIAALASVPALGTIGGLFSATVGNKDYGLISGALDSGAYFFQAQITNGAATAYPILLNPSGGNVGIGTASPTTLLDVNADTVRVRTARTPASATATGATGEICWDANYIYVAVGTNTWKRAALSTW